MEEAELKEPASANQSSNWRAVLYLAVFLIFSLATCIWTLGRIKDAVLGAVMHGGSSIASTALATIGPVDIALVVACCVSALLIILSEWRRCLFSNLLSSLNGRQAFVLLTLIVIWTGQCYLYSGVLLGGDTATHISRFLEVALGLQSGHLPVWTNYQYLGEPLLWFTGPLLYVVGGAVTAAVGDPTRAAKIILFTLHVVSGWLFYLLLIRIGFTRLASLLAAACYSSCFAILHLFLYRGVFPQAFTIVFLVTLFYAADGLLRVRSRLWADSLIFSLSTAGLIINHQPHALFAALYLFVFGMVAFIGGFWDPRGLRELVIAGVLGVVTSICAVLPTIAEADWVMISAGDWPFHVQFPTAIRLIHLLAWRDVRTTWGYDYWAYLGIGVIGGTFAGIWALASGRLPRPARVVTAATLMCLGLSFFLYNQVVRDVLYLAFFAAIVLAAGATWLQQAWKGRPRLLLGAAAIIILDLLTTSVQPIARNDKRFQIQAGIDLHDMAPSERVIQFFLEQGKPAIADMGPDNSAVAFEAPLARVAGNHNMAATPIHNILLSVIGRAQQDLVSDGHLSDDTSKLLALFNIGKVVCHWPTANGCPPSFAGTSTLPVVGPYVPIPNPTPIVFSRRLVESPLDPAVERPMLWDQDFTHESERTRLTTISRSIDRWAETEHVDLASRQAAEIPVRTRPEEPMPAESGEAWHPLLKDYAITVDTATWRIHTDAAGYAQLAFPWYPAMLVTVNGAAVTPTRGTLDLMVINIPAGDSIIEIRPAITRIERLSLWISALGLVATIGYSLWQFSRRARA